MDIKVPIKCLNAPGFLPGDLYLVTEGVAITNPETSETVGKVRTEACGRGLQVVIHDEHGEWSFFVSSLDIFKAVYMEYQSWKDEIAGTLEADSG